MMAPGPGAAEDTFPVEGDDVSDDDEFDIAGPEFRSINTAMDQLQMALDRLESSNAGIHEELLELLQSNREIRMAFNQESSPEGNCDENDSQDKEGRGNDSKEKYNAATSDPNSMESSNVDGTSTLVNNSQHNSSTEAALADLRLDAKQNETD